MNNMKNDSFYAEALRRLAEATEHYGTPVTCPNCKLHWHVKGERQCWCGRMLREGE